MEMTETASAKSLLKNEFPDEYSIIGELFGRIRTSGSKGDLGKVLADEVQKYPVFELQVIGGRLNNEISKLPNPYREAVRPYFIGQIFGMHHELLLMNRTGIFDRMNNPIKDPETFRKFCDMVPEGCFSWDDAGERNPYFRHPGNRLFYYLIAAFTMFVLEKPGHPVGMPFPGGFIVERKGDAYYCLIRDKEKEVFYSICNFCPAKQSEV
jgi:hypothetical protein